MISPALLDVVECPECRVPLERATDQIRCARCGRTFAADRGYLDLRPAASFAEQTRYLDDDLHADARHASIAPPLLGSRVRLTMLRRFLQPAAGDRAIDLGCGNGRTLAWTADTGWQAVGIDISPHFADEAVARFDVLLGDLRRLPIHSGVFTKAWSLDVLEHVSPQAFRDVLSEANRVLAPGGVLFVYTHVRRNGPLGWGVRMMNGLAHLCERVGLIDLRQERLRKSDHLNPIVDHDMLRREVASCGFEIARLTYYTPIIGAFVENVLARIVERRLVRRASRGASATSTNADETAVQRARRQAQARVRHRGATYYALRMISAVMMLDVWLFGRIRSGPYFALFRKVGDPALRATDASTQETQPASAASAAAVGGR
jgi:SAM-dependent methyltransferase